ncbi:putative selenate reductase subunit YgfK [Clostridium beijerinckii]|uniref:Selenate reductase subunit YgfK n=1 Tax=Clostridium beijerinckii TaxID=1520 RepID=A0AAW3WCT1_CLOBE|nr:putative selenate reductase subunit YgfK [Clostridium beijerinckii]MBC2459270.1 putative selenate reductase subunit YgfK [Clostridium beijerinckii]MBC2476800.1 putative selenate reductase subunit YgfK [Clostridium beijerinckii]MDG5856942.1 putative selenate reductase subunit YgfK [Clostridium beijerinckii]NOV59468.1 putative selenate reductase [Clostridium beijerinckii]NOV72623.1 putative selenate reductase [Clostridium beijerinckii]
MSDKMQRIPFEKMLTWITRELKEKESIFGVHKDKFYYNETGKSITLFNEKLSSPLGPAAGPNSQLTQNIVCAYLTGSRFIELKTVQVIDGEDITVSKPCINAQDEGYNVEWSTELKVSEAFDEYVKAWFLLHVLMKELKFAKERDFMFNMSVGYDLKGIKSSKIDTYIKGMQNASSTKIWTECQEALLSHIEMFSEFTKEDLEKISPTICSSITISTLHGCPANEIESIASYFLEEKKLNTYIKMNPTLLGEKFVKETLTAMGYDYIVLNGHHFTNDLQYSDGVAMLKRLKAVANNLNLEIGVKLTNTLPAKIINNELPGEEMYMSGRALFPLSISLASKLAKEFNGDLQISYSGGADFFNIDKILSTGISPITFATSILKPGGYERITQMAKKVEKQLNGKISGINVEILEDIVKETINDKHYRKEQRLVNSRKLNSDLQFYDCAVAPCSVGCPINQQIPQYTALVGQKKYDEAFSIIAIDNALPAITSTICNHKCQTKCTRIDYDESVSIRDLKQIAVLNAQDKFIESIEPTDIRTGKKVVIIGAGPAGLSLALFLRRNGVDVTVRDKKESALGVVEHVIPEFRISSEMIKKDLEMVKKQGVKFQFCIDENINLKDLKKEYDYVVLAIGAWKPGKISLSDCDNKAINAISFLEKYKKQEGNITLGKKVCVIGGGDVAMDAARSAKRVSGVEEVSIIYRRTKKYMPADNEEIELAISEGILLKELLTPISIDDGKLTCEKMILGDRDASLRRSSVGTGEITTLDTDTVIIATGEKIDSNLLRQNEINLDSNEFPVVNEKLETNIANVYIIGDLKKGPSTIVNAIADAKIVTKDILAKEGLSSDFKQQGYCTDEKILYGRKGILGDSKSCEEEADRCLGCKNICELCVDVCPNRANVMINVNSDFVSNHQIIHLDGMCNECGNCGIFCHHKGNPYKDKITVFWSKEDFENSDNKGFFTENLEKGICLVRTEENAIISYTASQQSEVSKKMASLIQTCIDKYDYML